LGFRSKLDSNQMHLTEMTSLALTDPSEYLNLDLRAHSILHNVPLHDVWRLDLPGGGEGRTAADIRSLALAIQPSVLVRFLFGIRRLVGRLLGWDRHSSSDEGLLQHRITEADRARSAVPTGTKDGPFTILYLHPNEGMSEVRNSTVHAALVWVLMQRKEGYRLFWAIYVKPVGRLTAIYMGLITPFRRWIVYPSLLSRLHRSWCLTYPAAA